MEPREVAQLFEEINQQINAIIKGQQIIAGIHDDLDYNYLNPLEQDYIYADHYGSLPSEPKTQIINDVIITTRILHQTGIGLRDISGGDLLYEIEGQKYIIVQKKRIKEERISADRDQLVQLIESCPLPCQESELAPLAHRLFNWCGAWYNAQDSQQTRYLPACRASSIFGGRSSVRMEEFARGISQTTFNELFASCYIGARINVGRTAEYITETLEAKHIIFLVSQIGRFSANNTE